MRTRHIAFILLATIVAIVGNIVPILTPEEVSAETGEFKWTRVDTPGSVPDRNDVISPSEVNHIAIGSDSKTFYAVDIPNANNLDGSNALYKSTDKGVSWSDRIGEHLHDAMSVAEQSNFHVWNVAAAPDNGNFIAAVTNDSFSNLPRNVWVSTDGGLIWQNTNCPANSNISAIDVSPYRNGHHVGIGTRTGIGNGTVLILEAPDYADWATQGPVGDILSLKFSPIYPNDSAVIIIYSDNIGTYLNTGIHDPATNTTDWNKIYNGSPPEITTGTSGTSPSADRIISTHLELPSDFSGQSPSLRRYYTSTDANGNGDEQGIFRIDNITVYQLMDSKNQGTNGKRIASIAYHGTFASGKLLAGEVRGNPCSAEVMTWFTDAPTTCPIPCWYPAMKPPTGAAGTNDCTGSGYGNAQVAWSPDGAIAYAATASTEPLIAGADWPVPYLSGTPFDESALSLSLKNGETWNQLSMIDTGISQFIDIAPAHDCSTLYLASVSDNTNCAGFDSVWRSQSTPLGSTWERVLCTLTSDQGCIATQTDEVILSLAGDVPSGAVIFWAAVDTQKMMWSPDSGDYWLTITPSLVIQDIAAEDSNTLYALSADGEIQKSTYSGTGWIGGSIISTGIDTGYSIATAYTGITPDNDKGHVIVGGTGTGGYYDVAYSTDDGSTFALVAKQLPTRGNTMVVASSSYNSDGYILAINSGGMYAWEIYADPDDWEVWWGGPSWPSPVTALAISRNYGFYFSTPSSESWGVLPATSYVRWSSATAGLDSNVSLGAPDQPSRRFRICGGLESGDPITCWAIDQHEYIPPQGGVWYYSDMLSWLGPNPVAPISRTSVNYDPVSGRASEINIMWNPRSLSRGYQIQIAKDEDFNIQVANIGDTWAAPLYAPYTPFDLDSPALVIPAGGGTVVDANGNTWTFPSLEADHTYYWKIKVQDVATGDPIQSPWSWRESFIVKAGMPVNAPYRGLKLLSPDNGCLGCPVKQPSFSWSPYDKTTRYKFILAKDPAMKDTIIETEVPTTSYECPNTLDYGTNYFWRVMAIEPHPSDWSATFCFQAEGHPVTKPSSQQAEHAALWPWLVIVLGTILSMLLIVLIIRSRQTKYQ